MFLRMFVPFLDTISFSAFTAKRKSTFKDRGVFGFNSNNDRVFWKK